MARDKQNAVFYELDTELFATLAEAPYRPSLVWQAFENRLTRGTVNDRPVYCGAYWFEFGEEPPQDIRRMKRYTDMIAHEGGIREHPHMDDAISARHLDEAQACDVFGIVETDINSDDHAFSLALMKRRRSVDDAPEYTSVSIDYAAFFRQRYPGCTFYMRFPATPVYVRDAAGVWVGGLMPKAILPNARQVMWDAARKHPITAEVQA